MWTRLCWLITPLISVSVSEIDSNIQTKFQVTVHVQYFRRLHVTAGSDVIVARSHHDGTSSTCRKSAVSLYSRGGMLGVYTSIDAIFSIDTLQTATSNGFAAIYLHSLFYSFCSLAVLVLTTSNTNTNTNDETILSPSSSSTSWVTFHGDEFGGTQRGQ